MIISFITGGGGGSVDPSNYYTKTAVDALLDEKADLTDLQDYVEESVFDEKEEVVSRALNDLSSSKADTSAVTSQISAAVSDRQPVSGMSAYTQQSDFAAHSGNTSMHTTAAEKAVWNGKQDALVSGTNIKTINSQSLLGSGNITIGGGGGTYVYYSEDTTGNTATIHIENTDGGTVGELLVDGGSVDMYASMTEEDEDNGSIVETHSDINGNSAGIAMAYEKNIDDAEATHSYLSVNENNISLQVSSDADHTTTFAVSNSAVTINNDEVVTVAQTSGLKFVSLTQSEYDQLATKDSTTIYFIKDNSN